MPEKEIIIEAPEEKISADDVEEGAILLDEEDINTGGEEEGDGAEDEEGEDSGEYDIDDSELVD